MPLFLPQFFRFRHYALAFHYISRRRFISFTTLPPALYLPSHPTHSIIIIVIMQGPSTGKPCNYIPQLLLHSKPLFFSFLYLGIFISLSLPVYLHFLYIYYKFGPKLSWNVKTIQLFINLILMKKPLPESPLQSVLLPSKPGT